MSNQLATLITNIQTKNHLGLCEIDESSKIQLLEAIVDDIGAGNCHKVIENHHSQTLFNDVEKMFSKPVTIDAEHFDDSSEIHSIEIRLEDNDDVSLVIMNNPTDRAMDLNHEEFIVKLAVLNSHTGFKESDVDPLIDKFKDWHYLNGMCGMHIQPDGEKPAS